MVFLKSLAAPKGLQTGPFGSQLKAEEYSERGVPVVMPKDIYCGKITVKGKSLIKDNIVEGIIPVVAGGQTYAYYHNMATHEMATITISASGAYAGFVWFHDYPIWASDCNVIYAKNASRVFKGPEKSHCASSTD